MDLKELPPAVQQLATIGGGWNKECCLDYRALGIGPEHTPVGMPVNLADLFTIDTPGLEELRVAQTRVWREESQTKNKRKQAKASHSKNRKRRKKKNK